MQMELLAPAGSPEALTAAVQSGADAVYLGYGPFHARRNAKNFSEETLAAAIAYCHLRGVKVYLTMNTLLTDREMTQAAGLGAQASDLGVDAVLVQDLGVARLLRDTVPDLPLHASTQMTVHNLEGVKACAELGMTRVVLSRELSRQAVERICARSPIEIEVFVHGALCMCYSGQCYLSAALGGRSGNRGICAQPCRLAYTWPGEETACHPLSLKDLSLAGQLQQLQEMGVACVKIEGRMKRPEYVAVVTKVFADALREKREPTLTEMHRLEAAFSRDGFTQGYYLERVGPCMFGTRKEGAQEPVELFEEARRDYQQESRRVPITFRASLRVGEPLSLSVADGEGHEVTGQGVVPEAARNRPITREGLTAQVCKTGGTVYAVFGGDAQVDEGLSVPLSGVNALRRQVLEELDRQRLARPARRVLPLTPPKKTANPVAAPGFTLSFRRWEQMTEAIMLTRPQIVWLPSDEIAEHRREAGKLVRQYPHISFGVAMPRIVWDREQLKLEEELRMAQEAGFTEALVGNLGQITTAKKFGFTLRGDFGLGLSSSLGVEELRKLGFVSCMVSFEWRLAQIRDLSKGIGLSLLVYGRMPLMITESCIIKNRGQGCVCNTEPQSLRDRKGELLPVRKAWGCRNEIFNPRVLWLADKAKDWGRVGASYARLSFTTESPAECLRVMEAYRGGGSPPQAFTRGLYYKSVE